MMRLNLMEPYYLLCDELVSDFPSKQTRVFTLHPKDPFDDRGRCDVLGHKDKKFDEKDPKYSFGVVFKDEPFPACFFLNFRLFFFKVQLVHKILPKLGFETRISGSGSDRSTN